MVLRRHGEEEADGAEYVEGEGYEYDTAGWIEREVYDDVATKLTNAEVTISDKNVEIDAMKNENENLKLKQGCGGGFRAGGKRSCRFEVES